MSVVEERPSVVAGWKNERDVSVPRRSEGSQHVK